MNDVSVKQKEIKTRQKGKYQEAQRKGLFLHQGKWQDFKSQMKQQGTSPVVQWLRAHLPMHRTRIWSLVQEDPIWHRATKPRSRKIPYATEQLSPRAATTESCAPRAYAPQQEKPLQWEAHTLQTECSPSTRASPGSRRKTQCSQKERNKPKKIWSNRNFSGSTEVKTVLPMLGRGREHGFDPWSGK